MIIVKHFSRVSIPFFIIGAVLLTGCQKKPSGLNEEDTVFRRGVVALNSQGLSFTPCYVKQQERLVDHTGRLQAKLENSSQFSFYTELSGSKVMPGEAWEAYEVHLIGGNQATCKYELSGNNYRAAGDGPTWVADVRDDGIHVQRYDRLKKLVFPLTEPSFSGQNIEWRSELSSIKKHEVTLNLDKQLCRDKYGIEYEYAAQMLLDGHALFGCARQGALDLRTLPGLYAMELKLERTQGRYISLELSSDKRAVLTQDYRNRQPLIVQTGSWQLMKNGRVVIHFVDINGRENNEVLVFERGVTGNLRLKGYSSTFGQSSLRLVRIGPERNDRKFNR